MSTEQSWFVHIQGNANGPFTLEEIKVLIQQGHVLGKDLMFREGAEQWAAASEWPEFAGLSFVTQNPLARLRSAAAPEIKKEVMPQTEVAAKAAVSAQVVVECQPVVEPKVVHELKVFDEPKVTPVAKIETTVQAEAPQKLEAVALAQKSEALEKVETIQKGNGDWTVLIRSEEKEGFRFKQEGPYPTERVIGLIQEGKLKATDHLWRKGFSQWAEVAIQPEFSPAFADLLKQAVSAIPTPGEGGEEKFKAPPFALATVAPMVATSPAPAVNPQVRKLEDEKPAVEKAPTLAAQVEVKKEDALTAVAPKLSRESLFAELFKSEQVDIKSDPEKTLIVQKPAVPAISAAAEKVSSVQAQNLAQPPPLENTNATENKFLAEITDPGIQNPSRPMPPVEVQTFANKIVGKDQVPAGNPALFPLMPQPLQSPQTAKLIPSQPVVNPQPLPSVQQSITVQPKTLRQPQFPIQPQAPIQPKMPTQPQAPVQNENPPSQPLGAKSGSEEKAEIAAVLIPTLSPQAALKEPTLGQNQPQETKAYLPPVYHPHTRPSSRLRSAMKGGVALLGLTMIASIFYFRQDLLPAKYALKLNGPSIPSTHEMIREESESSSANPEVTAISRPSSVKPEEINSLAKIQTSKNTQVVAPPTKVQATKAQATQMKDPPVVVSQPPQAPRPVTSEVHWTVKAKGLAGETVGVVVSGGSGLVLKTTAISVRMNQKVGSDETLDVLPQSLNLPEGKYSIQVFKNAKVVAHESKSFILEPATFEKRLAAHRKKIAFDQQQEKRALLRSLDGFEKFIQKNSSALSSDMTAKSRAQLWKSMQTLGRPELEKIKSPRHALAYPAGWSAYATQYEAVREIVTGPGQRKPASMQDLEQLRKKIASLRSQVSETSLTVAQ